MKFMSIDRILKFRQILPQLVSCAFQADIDLEILDSRRVYSLICSLLFLSYLLLLVIINILPPIVIFRGQGQRHADGFV